jgi:hypothetical protein
VIVFLNKSATAVLPDREVHLGVIGPHDRISVKRTGPGPEGIDIRKVSAGADGI